jgi:hypothetical protein
VLFFALFFARVFAGHRFIITGDSFFYSYPLRTIAWRMIRAGALPLWTPNILSVEMRYVAPWARNGAIISALTLALLGGLFLIARRQKHARAQATHNQQCERDA